MNGSRGRQIVFFLSWAAFVVALGSTPWLWGRLDSWVQNQRDLLWAQVEAVVGQKVVYDRIGPAVLAALEFQNVRVVADDGATLLQAASIRLSWDWEKIFQGRFAEAFRRVQVINASVSLDAQRDKNALDRWLKLLTPQGPVVPFEFQVETFNLTLRWTNGSQIATFDRVFAVLYPNGSQWGIRFRAALAWEDRRPPSAFARMTLRGELRSDLEFRQFNLRTEVASVRTTWFDSEPLTLQVSVDPTSITVAKVSDQIPLDLQASFDRKEDRWEIRGAAEHFQPSRLVRVKGLKEWSRVAEGTVTGRFALASSGDFRWTGSVSWPSGVFSRWTEEPVALSGAMEFQNKTFQFEDFSLGMESLKVRFHGTVDQESLLPEGELFLDQWLIPDRGKFSGQVSFVRQDRHVDFQGTNWLWNSLGSASPTGQVEHTGDVWKVQLKGPLDGTPAQVSLSTDFNAATTSGEAHFRIDDLPLQTLQEELTRWIPGFELPPEIWALSTSVDASAKWLPQQAPSIQITSFAFRDPAVPERTGSGTATWQGNHLDLSLDPSNWDSVQVGGVLSADWEPDGSVSGSVAGRLWEHRFEVRGRWVPAERTLMFAGSPGITGVFHQDEGEVWRVRLTLEPYEVVKGWTVGLDAQASLHKDSWTVDFSRMTVAGRYPWNQEAFSARARAHVDPRTVRLDDVLVNDSRGGWAGFAETTWSWDFSEPWKGALALKSTDVVPETVALDWTVGGLQDWYLNGKVSGLDLTRGGISFLQGVTGRVSISGSGRWNGTEAEWSAQASLSDAKYGTSPLSLRGQFAGTSRTLVIRDLSLAMDPFRISDGQFNWDITGSRWSAALGLEVRLGASDWRSRWTCEGTQTGDLSRPSISARVRAKDNQWSNQTLPDWSVDADWSPEVWQARFDGGLTVSGQGDGSFSARAVEPFPVRGGMTGRLRDDGIQASAKGFQLSLGLFKDLINTPPFSLVEGQLEGDFNVSGNLGDPELKGILWVRGMKATSSFVRQPIGPVDLPITLDGRRVRIDPVDVGPGPQTWMLSGAARLDHLLPEEYQIAVQTDALSVIPALYEYTGISASGGVTGQLVIRGTTSAVTIGGRLLAQDTSITLRPANEVPTNPNPVGFNVDLTMVTGRKVEFLWPNASLPLLRATAAPGQQLVIRSNEAASTWSVIGKIALRTGEINYLNRTFILREGVLGFQENQAGFDPRISVRAEWKVRETTGTTIINLRADGSLTRFSPRFDAVPYRSPEEMQQLVGTTLALPSDYTKTANLDTALSVASDVTTSFLLSPFERTVKENFQLDLFTVKTEILKKSLLGRNGPLEASDYLDNTRLFFGKYIGDDFFLQGTLAFRRDQTVATQVSPKMVVEPELQMEFQTPFFLLNWTLLPQHPKSLFVTDNTVTFRWNWSY